jgi:hypothetical protein
MVNEEHVALLKRGARVWNRWRYENFESEITEARPGAKEKLPPADLSGADLAKADLSNADLRWANLSGADLTAADLSTANLTHACLEGACLDMADLEWAHLGWARASNANLSGAKLGWAHIGGADFTGASLTGADLKLANMVKADCTNADLTGCRVYGVSAWELTLSGTKQQNLIITEQGEPEITVDNIEVAQFVHLLLHNEKIRDVIDTITSTAVLILGRFTKDRKAVLDALRDKLRNRGYLPILFDFEKSASRDITETVSLLARMARFVLADITDAKSIPQELGHIVPHLPSVPVQPLLLNGSDEYSMFEHYKRFPWVLPIHRYDTPEKLIADLGEKVILPAEIKVKELRPPQ